MPAKSLSPEAAQRKLWAAEIKTHNKAARQVKADFRNEQRRLIAASLAAHKVAKAAHMAVEKFMVRAEKQMPKQLNSIESRIAILKGRLGI